MKRIASTPYYDLSIDLAKSRIYFCLKGFVPSISVLSGLERDWQKALRLVPENSTLLADFSTLKELPEELSQAQSELLRVFSRRRFYKAARVYPRNAEAFEQIEAISRFLSLAPRHFSRLQEAENWLNA